MSRTRKPYMIILIGSDPTPRGVRAGVPLTRSELISNTYRLQRIGYRDGEDFHVWMKQKPAAPDLRWSAALPGTV